MIALCKMALIRNVACISGLVAVIAVIMLGIIRYWNPTSLETGVFPTQWLSQWMTIGSETNKMPSRKEEIPIYSKATFGMGCFWANDALFGAQQGVLRTRVGYAGGSTGNPVYKSMGDHTEVIEIEFDSNVISYRDLLRLFWDNHEYGLTTVIKRQYMSLILYHDEDQKRIAELDILVEAGKRNEKLITEIAPAGPFYPAENYHQKYRLQKHGWIVEELNITADQLQTSEVAAKLNGYLAGVGTQEHFEKDMKRLNIPERIASVVRAEFMENEGGNLYC